MKLDQTESRACPDGSADPISAVCAFAADYGGEVAALAAQVALDNDSLGIVHGHARGARLPAEAVERLLRDRPALDRIVAMRRALARGLAAVAASPSPLPPAVAHAFGVLGPAHEEALRVAVRAGRLRDAARLAFNGDWVTERVAAQVPLRFETSVGTSRRPAGAEIGQSMPLAGVAGAPQVIVSNGYELWRATQFKTCEPETIAWLEQGFREGDVLFDVGANIGIATLIAARRPGTRVVAFEPEPANFARLTENLRLNGLDNVVALPLALGDYSGIATLTLRDPVAGASAPYPLSGRGDGPTASCIVERLDAIAGLPRPTHVKIDVDGGQRAVLAGAGETLANAAVRELLIEMFDSEAADIDGLLAGYGLRRDAAYRRPGGDGDAISNVIYRRVV